MQPSSTDSNNSNSSETPDPHADLHHKPKEKTPERIDSGELNEAARKRSKKQPIIQKIIKAIKREDRSYTELIINAEPLETRVALLRDGVLEKFEVERTGEEVVIRRPVEQPTPPTLPCASRSGEELLGWGIPPDWIEDVRSADEEALLSIAERLPADAAEALLALATGVEPDRPEPIAPSGEGFEHLESQRAFRVIVDSEELERALESPWDRWTVFLHPAQRDIVDARWNGPARATGSAGTGKTIVALHRAVSLARRSESTRVLLTTFSSTLAQALEAKLRRLIGNEPRVRERIDVDTLDGVARRLWRPPTAEWRIAEDLEITSVLETSLTNVLADDVAPGPTPSLRFVRAEWDSVIDARRVESWEVYRDVPRLGRRTRLPESRRLLLWSVYERARQTLREQQRITIADVYYNLVDRFSSEQRSPWDHIVVDEAQDVSIPQLCFLAALRANAPDGLFFAGDVAQRIFRDPFSWASLGIEVRGRSRLLRVNYRTSHQIRSVADRLLDAEIADPDGLTDPRRTTISVFAGPPPEVNRYPDSDTEIAAVAVWLSEQVQQEISPNEIAVFVRSPSELDRAREAVAAASLQAQELTGAHSASAERIAIATMHLAKGLEFRAVVVMGCDEDVIPSLERIDQTGDEADLEAIYATERNLLYVACTRAREALLVTAVEPGSEFLEDLVGE